MNSVKEEQKIRGFDWVVHAGLFISGLAAFLFLFTNGVPLIQAGWMHEFAKKGVYVRLMGITVSVFAALMLAVRWGLPGLFERSCWVRLWKGFCSIPFAATVAIFVLAYALMMGAVGFERHFALETRAFDLGIFAQAVWNTLHGDIFFSSIQENINLMGDHVSPILILTAPFYAFWPDPRMLVLLQALAAASSCIPLALIVRDKLKERSFILIFLLLFIFYQPMRSALHEDFHPEVLAEPLLWWAFLFLDRGKIVRFLLCLAVAVTGKENFLGIAFAFGFYAFVWKKMRFAGTLLMLGSIGLFVWETKWLIPHLTGTKYFYGGNYSRMLADPWHGVVLRFLSPESLEYVLKVFMGFLFLPFFYLPALVLTFPVLFQNLLSVNGTMRSFNYHYMTGLTPFLFIASIFAVSALAAKHAWFKKHLGLFLFLLLWVGILRSGPSEYFSWWQIRSHRNSHVEMVRQKLREVPGQAIVLTHNSFIPQLCSRKYVYQFSYNPEPTKSAQSFAYKADYVIWDQGFWEPGVRPAAIELADLMKSGFLIQFEKDGFCVLRKK